MMDGKRLDINSINRIYTSRLQRILILLALLFLNVGLQAQENIAAEELFPDSIQNSRVETGLTYRDENGKSISSSKINVTNIKPTNELSVYEFLQGRVSGLDITGSFEPGKDAQAVIRGLNRFENNSPLIVIDGIPQKSLDNLFNQFNYNNDQIRSLLPVSLEDIESIEVLKDGSTTSLYGAEGANGVILIETKKGSLQKMSVTYEFNQSFVNRPAYTPMLNGEEYVMYQLEAWHNSKGQFTIPNEIAMNKDYPGYYNYSANTNWMEEITQPASASNHYLSIYGGNDKNRYHGSVNYLDQGGTTINTDYNRLLSRLNFEHYFTKKLTLGLNLSYLYDKNDGNVNIEDGNGGQRDVLEMAFIKAPNMSIWEFDAEGNKTGAYFSPANNYQGNGLSYYNPVAVSELGNATRTTNDLMATAHLQYKLTNWFRLRETFTYNRLSTDAKANLSSLQLNLYPFDLNNTSEMGSEHFRNEVQAFVKIPFKDEKKHLLNGTFSWIWQDEEDSIITNNSERAYTNLFYNGRKSATVGSIYYKLLDRYILNANARLESVSLEKNDAFENKHYGANLAWQFSNESFLKGSKLLNRGIIRGGWSYSEYYTATDFTNFSATSVNSRFQWNYFFNTVSFITTPTYSLGLELSMFNNRLHFTGDYYYEQPERELIGLPFSTTTLKMNNKGWEADIDYTIIRKREMTWTLKFNIAHNDQSYDNLPSNIYPTLSENGKFLTLISNDNPLGSIYGLQNQGVYSSDEDAFVRDREGDVIYSSNGQPLRVIYGEYLYRGGDTKYKDMNYDGRINEADVVYLGNVNPEFTGGFGSTIRFRNLTLTGNFHYRTGNEIINQTAMDSEGLYSRNNQSKAVLNRWRVQGMQEPGLMPRAYLDHPANNLGSDLYVESGSFVRMNYLSLGYSFGSAFCQKIKVKELNLNLSGQSLYTNSRYSGLNPGMELSGYNRDHSRIAPPKIYALSVRVTI